MGSRTTRQDLLDETRITRSRVKVELPSGRLLASLRLGVVARFPVRRPMSLIDDDSFVHRDPSAGDMWPAQFFTERGAKSVMISCPTFWAGEMPTSAGLVINPLWFSRGRLLPSLRLCLGISDESSPVLPWSPPTFSTALSIVVPSSSGGVALDDSRAVEALEMLQSCFNVDSTVTAHRLVDVREHYYVPPEYELHVSSTRGVRDMNETWLAKASLIPAPQEMFNLGRMKSGSNVGSGSVAPSMANASPTVEVVFMAEKHPSIDADTKLRKRNKRTTSEQLAGATESTTKAPTEKGRESIGKGKEPVEVEEVPEWGYSIRDLCEVEDRAGANGYFTSIMT
ncbi:hypothetical protein BHE74_00008591 [Ensete ventricosum]|nr:hypothetical protein BHE74_00008591 [Ensete ventricosum]